MTEQMAAELARVLRGDAVPAMPGSRTWGVQATCTDGRFVAIEDGAAWAYRDRQAFEAYQQNGDDAGLLASSEWEEWGEGEEWADGLSKVLGSNESWQSGGGIWLVFYPRPDGRFAVIGSDSAGIYPCRETFETDVFGEKAENHVFV